MPRIILFALILFAAPLAAAADFGMIDVASRGWTPFFSEFLRSIDATCFVCLIILVITIGLGVDAFYLIRISRLIPDYLLGAVQEEMANGEYEKALEISAKSDCLAGHIFSAALSKTDHSFERMEEAMHGEADILSLIWRQWVGQFKLLALLGFAAGILGALINILRLIAELQGRPNLGLAFSSSYEMRALLYSIFGALFFGFLSATLALIIHRTCLAKLERILLEGRRLGEELLDPFRPLPQVLEDDVV